MNAIKSRDERALYTVGLLPLLLDRWPSPCTAGLLPILFALYLYCWPSPYSVGLVECGYGILLAFSLGYSKGWIGGGSGTFLPCPIPYTVYGLQLFTAHMFRTDDQFVPLINGTPVDQPGTRLFNWVPGCVITIRLSNGTI